MTCHIIYMYNAYYFVPVYFNVALLMYGLLCSRDYLYNNVHILIIFGEGSSQYRFLIYLSGYLKPLLLLVPLNFFLDGEIHCPLLVRVICYSSSSQNLSGDWSPSIAQDPSTYSSVGEDTCGRVRTQPCSCLSTSTQAEPIHFIRVRS